MQQYPTLSGSSAPKLLLGLSLISFVGAIGAWGIYVATQPAKPLPAEATSPSPTVVPTASLVSPASVAAIQAQSTETTEVGLKKLRSKASGEEWQIVPLWNYYDNPNIRPDLELRSINEAIGLEAKKEKSSSVILLRSHNGFYGWRLQREVQLNGQVKWQLVRNTQKFLDENL